MVRHGRCNVDRFDDRRNRVVHLGNYRSDMRYPAISEVRAYWEALRDGRAAPYRPRSIRAASSGRSNMPSFWNGLRRRRHGSAWPGCTSPISWGWRCGACRFHLLHPGCAGGNRHHPGERVFRAADGRADHCGEIGSGQARASGQILLLPLRSDLGDVSRALGCLVTEGPIGRTPRRFEVRESLAAPIAATVPDPGRPVAALPGFPPARGFAEPALPFTGPRQPSARGRAQLRLVARDE